MRDMNKTVLLRLLNVLKSLREREIFLIIVIVGFVLYGKSILFTYTYDDDKLLLITNQTFIGNISNLPKLFTTDVFISKPNIQTFYRPLLNLLSC